MERSKPLPFTSNTRVAIAIARAIAAARGDRDVTKTHVAAAIFREGSNVAVAGLWYAGLPEAAIKSLALEFEYLLGPPRGGMPPRLVTVDNSPAEEEVTRAAEAETDRRGDPYLGTEHYLLGILRSDNAVSRKIAELGIDAEKFEDGLNAAVRGDPPPHEPRAV